MLRLTIIPAGLALLVAGILVAEIQFLVNAAERLARPERVTAQANAVRTLIIDAETGVRGFSLTDDESYLEPYVRSQQSIAAAFDKLRTLASDYPDQLERIDRIQLQQQEWVQNAENALQIRRRSGDSVTVGQRGSGKRLVDGLRHELDEFIHVEEDRREVRFAASQSATRFVMWSTAGLALVLGTGIGVVARRQLTAITSTYDDALELAHRSVEALRTSEERYRLLVDGVKDYAILGLESDGLIVTWSSGAESIFGYTADDVIRRDVTMLFADHTSPDGENRLPGDERLLARLAQEPTRRCRRRDGDEFYAEASVSAFRDDRGEVLGFSLLLRDVTVRKELEDAIRQQNERLEKGVRERTVDLESANRLLALESANHLAARQDVQRYADEVQDLYNNAPCGYHSLDEEGVINLINDTELRWLGLERDAVVGRMRFRELLSPKSRMEFDERFPVFKSTGQIQGLEFEMLRADGSVMYVLINATATYDADGLFRSSRSTLFDITQRRRVEAEAARVRERYAALIEASSMAVYTLDADGQGTEESVAAAWEAITGLSRIPGDVTWWVETIHPDDRERIRSEFTNAIALRIAYELELRVRTRAGRYRVFLSRAVPIFEPDGDFREWVGTLTDVTARAEAERTVRDLNRQLASQVTELHSANAELDSFAYSVSHDLRAPLRAIDGFSRILSEDCSHSLSPDCLEHVAVIRDNTLQMGLLIDDLLAFSRLGRTPVSVEHVDVRALVLHVLDGLDIRPDSSRTQINIGDLPPCTADPNLLKRVFTNLIANALKYSGKCENATVEIGSVPSTVPGEEVTYYVRDNGVGFDMRYANKLFGVFQRLHRSEDFEGTGVGLAIVHRIISRHGGRVWAEGAVNAGATFSFALPKEMPT